MRDRLTRSNACEHHIFFALPVRRNDHANRLADGFGGRIAKHAFRRQIPRGDDAVEILADDRIIRRFHDRDEPSAGEGRLHPVRNVPGDFRCANHLTRVVVNRRHRQRNRDERPVLPLPDGLEMRDRLTGSDACQHHVFFALPIGRDEHANGLADGLSGGVAEHAFGRPIPRRDDAVQILADDGVI